MSIWVKAAKKMSAFCTTGLEDFYYYKILFTKIQKELIKKNPCIRNKNYEKNVRKYYVSHGYKINPMWHTFYSSQNGIYDVRYIPENLYFGKIEPFYNKKAFAKAIDDKNYYDLRLDTSIAHIPHIFIRNIEGCFYNHDFEIIDENEAIMICQSIDAFVIKPSIEGKGGADVKFINTQKEDKKSIKALFDIYKKDYVVQAIISQDGILHEINPSSVNTVRFMTFNTGKDIVMLSAVLRMGGKDEKVDNACSGGIFCGIDENGITKSVAWNKKFEKFYKHPNGNEFKNITIPHFAEAIDMLRRQHMRGGHFRLLSWDVAISSNDIAIIEFNITPQEIDFHQVCNGPLFGEYTEQVLEEVRLNTL